MLLPRRVLRVRRRRISAGGRVFKTGKKVECLWRERKRGANTRRTPGWRGFGWRDPRGWGRGNQISLGP